MQKHEFEEFTASVLNEKDYEKIETVYMFHPAISDTHGKEQIAQLWMIGGIGLIEDMLPMANQLGAIEKELDRLNAEACEIRKRYRGTK